MSLFGGRRASSPALDHARSPVPTSVADEATARPPHFYPVAAPLPHLPPVAAEVPTVDEARHVAEQLRLLLAELGRREASLNSRLERVEREQRELHGNAQQLAEAQRILEAAFAEREASIVEQAAAAAEQQAAVDQQQAELDRQRAELREQLWAEVAEQRRDVAESQAALESGRGELTQLRERLREALLAEVAADRSRLAAQRADLEQERARVRTELEAELVAQHGDLDKQRQALERQRAEFAVAAETWQASRDQAWQEQNAQLELRRQERLADIEARDAAVGQREVDLIKRTRFHEEHLDRLRKGIEAKQIELERHRAAIFVWNADVEATLRSRLVHLGKFRGLLEQREAACDAAWRSVAEARDRQQQFLHETREHLAAERASIAEQQQLAAGDLRRQADLLRLREEEVARQSARFDQWEHDLERRSREWKACEAALQLAIDTLSDQVGAAVVRRLLAQAAVPADGPASEADQSAELLVQEQQLVDWREELQRERDAFAELTAAREERLCVREAALSRQLDQLVDREAALHADQARDRAEREQAFAILESLVSEIERRRAG